MSTAFTQHVKNFGPQAFPGDDVLGPLRQLLRRRMRLRNLLGAPPSYLGYDAPSWTSDNSEEAWEDVVIDCYLFAIVDRLQGLRNQLAVHESIDGFVVRNVDNFLIERQRRQDRVGYATYQNAAAAVRRAEAAGRLAVEGARQGRLHNQTLLRLGGAPAGAEPAAPDRLRELLDAMPRWDEAFPRLLRTGEEAQQWLVDFLDLLRREGVQAARFGDLVDAVGRRVRESRTSRHAARPGDLALEGDDDFVEVVMLIRPDDGAERREGWERLRAEVEADIRQMSKQKRVRDRLLLVFREIVRRIEEDDGRPIRQADLVKALTEAPAVINGDFKLLGEILKNRQTTRGFSGPGR